MTWNDPDFVKEYNRAYRSKNRDQLIARQREYRSKNKDQLKAGQRKYRTENKDKINEHRREHYAENRVKIREHIQQYYTQNSDQINANRREHRAKNKPKARECARQYRTENKDKIKESNRQYYTQNSDQINANRREYRAQNSDRIKASRREYYAKNKETVNAQQRKHYATLRSRFFEVYGSKCACCGEDQQRFLTLSHKQNDGKAERRSYLAYRLAVKHPDSTRYETLCYNCNMGIAHNHLVCPHKDSEKRTAYNQERSVSYKGRIQRASKDKMRARFFEIYGKECACCGEKMARFLTVGHINGDGHKDRAENGSQDTIVRKAIKNPDFKRYQTQCYNCNIGASKNGGICPHKNGKETRP